MGDNLYADAIQSTTPEYPEKGGAAFIGQIKIIAEPIDAIGKIGAYVNFSARAEANNPKYQWYDKRGASMPRMCRSNLTIGPIEEKDFGFYCLEVKDGQTNQTVLTRWAELKKAQPRVTQSVVNEYQQVEPTEPLPQSSPVPHRQFPESQLNQEFYYTQHQLEKLTPKLLIQPEGGVYSRGSRITLTAHFENATHHQWYKDGVKLEGCTGNTLIINNANPNNIGDYDLYASNNFGSNFSRTRILIY